MAAGKTAVLGAAVAAGAIGFIADFLSGFTGGGAAAGEATTGAGGGGAGASTTGAGAGGGGAATTGAAGAGAGGGATAAAGGAAAGAGGFALISVVHRL